MGRSRKNATKKRQKLVIEFDERKRAEFLTGFKRRKDQRRRKAKEELQQILKAEKKHIKKKKSEEYAAQMRELAPELMSADKQIYDLPNHTVTITEISGIDLMSAGGAYLGMNAVIHTRISQLNHFAGILVQNPVDSASSARSMHTVEDSSMRVKQEAKAGKSKSRRSMKQPHLSFTHSLNKRRRLDTAERRKLKRKQNK